MFLGGKQGKHHKMSGFLPSHLPTVEDPWGNISPEFAVHFDIQSCRAFAGEVQVSWNFGVWCWGMLRLDVKPYRKLDLKRVVNNTYKYNHIYIWHHVFLIVFLMSEDIKRIPRCSTWGRPQCWRVVILIHLMPIWYGRGARERNFHRTHSRGSLYGKRTEC